MGHTSLDTVPRISLTVVSLGARGECILTERGFEAYKCRRQAVHRDRNETALGGRLHSLHRCVDVDWSGLFGVHTPSRYQARRVDGQP